jgi:hypothetical protein
MTLTLLQQNDGMNRRAFCLSISGTFALGIVTSGALVAPCAHAAEEKKKGGGKGYTQFPMITVFTQAHATHHGTMSVDMGLYTDDAKLQDQIKTYMPRLQDAYLSRLQGYANAMSANSLADSDFVSLQLQQATDKVLGHTGAKVLLGSILLN